MKFPRLVYKSASNHLCVNDEAEYKAAISAGWFASVPEALAPKLPEKKAEVPEVQVSVEPKDNAPPTRAEMEAKATELGIKFDGRTTDAKLLKMIAEAV